MFTLNIFNNQVKFTKIIINKNSKFIDSTQTDKIRVKKFIFLYIPALPTYKSLAENIVPNEPFYSKFMSRLQKQENTPIKDHIDLANYIEITSAKGNTYSKSLVLNRANQLKSNISSCKISNRIPF